MMSKACVSCEYEGTNPLIKPCRLCVDGSKWKPKWENMNKKADVEGVEPDTTPDEENGLVRKRAA